MMRKRNPSSKAYDVGYGRPPKKFQFQRGRSGNPAGINRKADRSSAPDLRASLKRELNKPVKIQHGNTECVVTQGEAGIRELVRQFVEGDARARRDLRAFAEDYGIDLAPSKTIENALADAVSADDEALLADFVKRHGGHYHRRDDSVGLLPRQESDRLTLSLNGSNLAPLPRERLDD